MAMSMSRRHFVGLAAGALAAGVVGNSSPVRAGSAARTKCLAFDALAVFDPHPVAASAEQAFPGKGSELMNLWRARQFEYTWLRSTAQRYADFMKITEDSLIFAACSLKLDLTSPKRDQL